MKRWLRGLLMLTIILMGLVAVLYASSPFLAEKIVRQWLTTQGFSDVVLNMQRPAFDEFRITRFAARRDAEDSTLVLSSDDIRLEYNPVKFWRDGKLELIELPQSNLIIQFRAVSSEIEPEESAGHLDLSTALPALWLTQLPSDLVRMGALNVSLDYPDDQPDWTFNGALQTDAGGLYSRVQFHRNNEDLGWGDLELSPDNRFKLRMLQQDQAFLTLDSDLRLQDQLLLTTRHQMDLGKFRSWLTRLIPEMALPELTGELSGTGTVEIPVLAPLSPDQILREVKFRQQLKIKADVLNVDSQVLHIKAAINASVDGNRDTLNVRLHDETAVRAVQPAIADLKTDYIRFGLRSDLSLTVQLPDDLNTLTEKDVSVSDFRAQIRTGNPLIAKPASVFIAPMELRVDSVDLAEHKAKVRLDLPRIDVALPDQKLPGIGVVLNTDIGRERINTWFRVRAWDTPLRVKGRGATRMDNMQTQLSWTLTPVSLTSLEPLLRRYTQLLPPELTVTDGTLFHNGEASLSKAGRVTGKSWHAVKQGGVVWNKTRAQGIDLDASASWNGTGRYTETGLLNVGQVLSGVRIDTLKTRYGLSRAPNGTISVGLSDTQANLLGGTVKLKPFNTALDTLDVKTEVSVERMDVAEILALERQKGLSGRGTLSGQFPLEYSAAGVEVKDGELDALAPGGYIRYQPDAAIAAYAVTNPGLSMALGALENFEYDTLSVKLNYHTDGTALLATRLKGKNPDWNKGHPVDFTVNVEENIPDLLRTLQFADELTEKLEKRYRDGPDSVR